MCVCVDPSSAGTQRGCDRGRTSGCAWPEGSEMSPWLCGAEVPAGQQNPSTAFSEGRWWRLGPLGNAGGLVQLSLPAPELDFSILLH